MIIMLCKSKSMTSQRFLFPSRKVKDFLNKKEFTIDCKHSLKCIIQAIKRIALNKIGGKHVC